jgi:hypothetical protein
MKKFFAKDKSGRGFSAELTEKHILETWDLTETEYNNGMELSEFLEDCVEGDVFKTNSITLTCINDEEEECETSQDDILCDLADQKRKQNIED